MGPDLDVSEPDSATATAGGELRGGKVELFGTEWGAKATRAKGAEGEWAPFRVGAIMGEARAKAAGEIGGPIRFGRKTGVSGAVPKGRAVPEDDWGKGTSKGVEAIAEGGGNGEGWLAVARGHCWGAREPGGGRAGPGCPKAAVTRIAEKSTVGKAKKEIKKGRKKTNKNKGELCSPTWYNMPHREHWNLKSEI